MVWVTWGLGYPVNDEHLVLIDSTWDRADESFCAGIDRVDSSTVSLTFDVSASTPDEALADARTRVEELLRQTGLGGAISGLTVYTEEGWFHEDSPPDSS